MALCRSDADCGVCNVGDVVASDCSMAGCVVCNVEDIVAYGCPMAGWVICNMMWVRNALLKYKHADPLGNAGKPYHIRLSWYDDRSSEQIWNTGESREHREMRGLKDHVQGRVEWGK